MCECVMCESLYDECLCVCVCEEAVWLLLVWDSETNMRTDLHEQAVLENDAYQQK